jgi:hypothetical protein
MIRSLDNDDNIPGQSPEKQKGIIAIFPTIKFIPSPLQIAQLVPCSRPYAPTPCVIYRGISAIVAHSLH